MSGMHFLFTGVHSAFAQSGRDAGAQAVRTSQSVFLQYHDGGNPGSDRKGRICKLQGKKTGRDGFESVEAGIDPRK